QTSLTTKIWYQYAFRQIPPTRFQARSVATQEDEALRMQAAFRQIRTNGLQEFQASYINESLVYRDSIADINSDTRTHLLQLDANREWEWTANQRLLLNARYTFTEARSSNYEGRPKRHQSALFASYRLRLAPKWKLQLDARQELVDDQLVPFIPGLRVTFDVSQQLQLSVLASRFFRLPTFNDWFWPSGNPDLRPENGWGQELGLQWATAHLNISLNGFHKQMQDWIIWLPNGPDYTPQNVKTVRIIGTDLQVKWQQSWHDWQLRLEGYAQWLQAQNQESRQAGDASLGLQLIYTPLWQGRFQTNLQYRDWQLFYQQNYTGQVFTTIDHSDGLGAFSLGDLRLAKAFNWKRNKWLLYASVRNIWDVDYEVVAQRPMPGRMLEFGLQLKLKQN
ncbi:MAG: TonB-dependent receptor, partial [Saprospiraceae bacterium]|nr:TonB-dependent receptor [Saprospiraceae bacterium]